MDNVARVPSVTVRGHSVQRIDVEQAWFSPARRLRHVQFGSTEGRRIVIPRGEVCEGAVPAALASDSRTWQEVRQCLRPGLFFTQPRIGFQMAFVHSIVGGAHEATVSLDRKLRGSLTIERGRSRHCRRSASSESG